MINSTAYASDLNAYAVMFLLALGFAIILSIVFFLIFRRR